MNEREMPDEVDEGIRKYLQEAINDVDTSEMLTDYFIVAATRDLDNNGQAFLVSKRGIPKYILEGMMRRALYLIDA